MTKFSNKIKKSYFWSIFVAKILFSKTPGQSSITPHGLLTPRLVYKRTNEPIRGILSRERIVQ